MSNFIDLIELNLKLKAKKKFLPIQPGDVPATFADISESKKDLKFSPKTEIKKEFQNLLIGTKSTIKFNKVYQFPFL